jgi:excisionase family DNA binding protein
MEKLTYTTTEAAQYLGISRSTLYRRLTQKGLSAKKHPSSGQSYFDQEILCQLESEGLPSEELSTDHFSILSEQISQIAAALQDIQTKQDTLLELLRQPVQPTKASLQPAPNNITAANGNPAQESASLAERISPREYTLELIKLCEQSPGALNSGHPLLAKLTPANLDRGLLAEELDKAWIAGDYGKQECLKNLLKRVTTKK